MHCWKTINVEYEYGTTRLFLLSGITFIFVFCFAYIALSFNYTGKHNDHNLWLLLLVVPFIYPLHKLLHYVSLFDYKKSLVFRFKIRHVCIPIVHMRLQQTIPKHRYLITLLTPFFFLNTVIIILGVYFQQYAHYFSLLLALHCSICLMDILYVKNLVSAPRNAIIEETPKGYEILVPTII
ncbi:DUF3267 domain-containing protein [Solibacillus sp. FSL H8-0538]|uniref:DUF3267 domain-containing protein n=1 Tax=Solibacillus sp. FSL H8-0538 TaxID=2921400 RepID=UPI0030F8ED5A